MLTKTLVIFFTFLKFSILIVNVRVFMLDQWHFKLMSLGTIFVMLGEENSYFFIFKVRFWLKHL